MSTTVEAHLAVGDELQDRTSVSQELGHSIHIVGAGLAGMLAANMLRNHRITVYEWQKGLPNNHSAILRFRTSQIGDVLGIPFKKVKVIKDVVPWRNPVADALAYSRKNGGEMRSDRSINSSNELVERYIAPHDLIARMAAKLQIKFGQEYNFSIRPMIPIISTIAMPLLMKILKYPDQPAFKYVHGFNVTADVLNCDAYVSLAVPDPDIPFSRVSLTGNQMIIEVPATSELVDTTANDLGYKMCHIAADLLGLPNLNLSAIKVKQQRYAKILPIDDDARRDFIYWATAEHNVFSLGRFATWRPGLLMDDLVKDVRLIENWITRKDRYAIRHRS